MNRSTSTINGQRGFSLLELMSALLITAVLLTIALPAWEGYTFRIERTAALTSLQQAAQCQAHRAVWTTGADPAPDPDCLPPRTTAYRFFIAPSAEPAASDPFTNAPAAPGYEWRAEPLGRQRGDACGTLVLDHRGRRSVLGTAEQALRCWQGR
ncbi:MAG: prepilin-type N-terminal cleavage/methylation domain-containing protein [Xanthomonadales bacterium]|jgi:type IV pilus assembly protein PilE|nr:prepilin-type N-terminal cleavage/methylation domain-containing protein [Xanthomonadales bacterium]